MPLHFTPSEYATRREKARAALHAQGLGALLMFAPESQFWISGYDTFGFAMFQCMVLTARGDLHLLGIFGTNDPWCPLDQVDELEASGAEVVRYDGADHGWAQDPTRDNYREADATDAWARAEAFLEG